MTRVAIVAASASARARLTTLLDGGGSVTIVATAASSEAAAGDSALASADVVLLHADGSDVAARDLDALLSVPVVVLLRGPPTRGTVPSLLVAGARGVLPDDSTAEEISAAVEAAAAGLVTMPSEQVADLVGPRSTTLRSLDLPDPRRASTPRAPLTPREREILAMLAEGMPNKLIASRLGISDHTVKTHLEAIFDKLGASNRAEAVARAVRAGMLLL